MMTAVDKVKLMDSGTALFPAGSLDDAVEKVRAALSAEGGMLADPAPANLVLDYSDRLYHKVITAHVEATSVSGRYAASFHEGNSATQLGLLLLRFGPARSALLRMQRILRALATD